MVPRSQEELLRPDGVEGVPRAIQPLELRLVHDGITAGRVVAMHNWSSNADHLVHTCQPVT